MAELKSKNLRNISVVGHGSTGKTQLTSAILFSAKATSRFLKVDEGNTITDFDEEEIKRNISISSSMAYYNYNKNKVNIFDTPGFGNFIQDAKSCINVTETSLIVVCGVSGVEVQTEKVYKDALDFGAARAFFINKLDRERGNFESALESIQESFESDDTKVFPVFYPIGSEAGFKGIIDIFNKKAYYYKDDLSGNYEEKDIPVDLADKVNELYDTLIENIVEDDEELMERYLGEEHISREELIRVFKDGFHKGKFCPVFCGSGLKNIGIKNLLEWIDLFFPAPSETLSIYAKEEGKEEKVLIEITDDKPFLGYVFKTTSDPFTGKITFIKILQGALNADTTMINRTNNQKERIGQLIYLMGKNPKAFVEAYAGDICAIAKLKSTNTGDTVSVNPGELKIIPIVLPEPIMSFAIEPKTKKDEEKISTAISRLSEEDPTFVYKRDAQTNELILSGMGQQHVEVIVSKLKNKYNVDVDLKPPKVPYKETIKASAKSHGRYKKQTGGKGQFGDCHIEISPLERGKGFEFVNSIVGGAIPKTYIPAVEKGIVGAMEEGIVAGYPVVDVRVELYDGSYHPVDSSEIAFKIAGSMGFKAGFKSAQPVLLEPYMKLSVVVPDEFMGDINGDVASKRGRILGMDSKKGRSIIEATVPMSELFNYSNELKSMTGGRGNFNMEFSHYEEVPHSVAEKIIEEYKTDEEN